MWCHLVHTFLATAGIQHIPRSRLRLIRKLGEGEFGSVFLGLCYQLPGPNDITTVAVKALKRVHIDRQPQSLEFEESHFDEILRDFEREAELLDGLRHEKIVTFYGISIDNGPLMVLEYMENGDLNNFLRYLRFLSIYTRQ